MNRILRSIAAGVVLAASGSAIAQTLDEPAVRRAMDDELARTLAQLRLADQQAPYYVAYEVADHRFVGLQASGGVVSQVSDNRSRLLNVDVRIGTPQSDSSRVIDNRLFGTRTSEITRDGSTSLPLGDDYDALRRKLWIASDIAYKRALEDHATRQAVAGARAQGDLPPDQLPVPALQQVDDMGELRLDLPAMEQLLREVSAAVDAEPAVEQSVVWLTATQRTVRFVASDGTATWLRRPGVEVGLVASTRATDGEPLIDHWSHRVLLPADLPPRDALVAQARELGQRLATLRTTPPLRDYTGPVLFSDVAAAQLVALRLAPKLGPLPRFYTAEAPMQSYIDQMMEPTLAFARRIGARVLPAGGELVDDPTLREWNGVRLPSAGAFDSEGVATQRKVLVADGRLKTLLSTRAPALLEHVTPGNQRGTLPATSTLVLRSDEAVDAAGMQREIDLALQGSEQPWILEVERFTDEVVEGRLNQSSFSFVIGGSTPSLPRVARASKRFPDGRREPLRGIALADIGEREFRHVVAIGDTPTLLVDIADGISMLSMMGRRNTGGAPQAYLVPPLLFEELSAAEDTKEVRRLPILAKPSTAAGAAETP